MVKSRFIAGLKASLNEQLPGWDAQRLMIPEGRGTLPVSENLRPAAVLIALYKKSNSWVFPLIKRSSDGLAHSGQVALPGGRQDGNESTIETALREAWEEVNIDAEDVQVIGKLSPLPIPVSGHLVYPVIGYLTAAPELVPDPREVAEIFTVSVQDLKQIDIQIERREFRQQQWDIPYLEIKGHKVWGATAMILSEFREILTKF